MKWLAAAAGWAVIIFSFAYMVYFIVCRGGCSGCEYAKTCKKRRLKRRFGAENKGGRHMCRPPGKPAMVWENCRFYSLYRDKYALINSFRSEFQNSCGDERR